MRRIIIISLFAGCLLLTIVLLYTRWASKNTDRNEYQRMMVIKKIYKELERKIDFYGRVIDQYDKPVDGAEVSAHIMHFSPKIKDLFGKATGIEAITDSSGNFMFSGQQGRSVYIDNIQKRGYEFEQFKNNPDPYFEYSSDSDKSIFIPDKNNPVTFRLRKQKDATFLLENIDWNCHISSNESGTAKGYDFIRQTHVRNLTKPVLNGEPLVCDILGKATFNTNDAKWTVVLAPGNTNGGIIASDQLLYEAPQNGYQLEYVFVPEDRKPKPKYIYLRSRDPAIYTRIEITYMTAIKEYFNLKGKSVTNPYGDRNLEKALNLPYEVTKQLTDEVKSCFRKNKRPSKPDPPKLIREAERVD